MRETFRSLMAGEVIAATTARTRRLTAAARIGDALPTRRPPSAGDSAWRRRGAVDARLKTRNATVECEEALPRQRAKQYRFDARGPRRTRSDPAPCRRRCAAGARRARRPPAGACHRRRGRSSGGVAQAAASPRRADARARAAARRRRQRRSTHRRRSGRARRYRRVAADVERHALMPGDDRATA
ncbi:MAG: hypothetical protein HS111_12975 [Kofleriaceae bacterium]|nr:hypothetical protein [Kofleriaceae bacterium]